MKEEVVMSMMRADRGRARRKAFARDMSIYSRNDHGANWIQRKCMSVAYEAASV